MLLFFFFLTTTLNNKFGLCWIEAQSGDSSRAHLLIFPAGWCQWGVGQCEDGRYQDHYPSTKRVWGLSSISQCTKPLRIQVSFQLEGLSGSWSRRGGSLGNGLCLILLSSFVCATVQRGLCSGVQETFCAGGDIKGWGCSQGELGNGGCCAGLHFKSHKMGFQNPGLSYKLQGCFFIIGAPVLGPFFCFLPSCRHFPAASQAQ